MPGVRHMHKGRDGDIKCGRYNRGAVGGNQKSRVGGKVGKVLRDVFSETL